MKQIMKRIQDRILFEAGYIREHRHMALVGYVEQFKEGRFGKQYTATLPIKPGVTRLRLTLRGIVVADLLLSEVTIDSRDGASARFENRAHTLRRNRA